MTPQCPPAAPPPAPAGSQPHSADVTAWGPAAAFPGRQAGRDQRRGRPPFPGSSSLASSLPGTPAGTEPRALAAQQTDAPAGQCAALQPLLPPGLRPRLQLSGGPPEQQPAGKKVGKLHFEFKTAWPPRKLPGAGKRTGKFVHAETRGSACAKDAARGRVGVAEGVRETLDPTAESRPGRGNVPRGNGAALASASAKNAEMWLSVSVSICALAGAQPGGLLSPPEDARPCLGRGFAGGAQGSCLGMGRHRAWGHQGTGGMPPAGSLSGWSRAGWHPWAVLGAPRKDPASCDHL